MSYGHLIDEAKCLAKNFIVVLLSHIRKQDNSIGHNLAKHVSKFSVSMNDVLSHLNTVILANIDCGVRGLTTQPTLHQGPGPVSRRVAAEDE